LSAAPATVPTTQLRHQAEGWAARLPDLRIQALRVAATVALGGHGRRRPGPGDSFWQFRDYRQGDALRGIDWRRSGRSSGRIYIREREWETAESFWLWLDQSPSMAYSAAPKRPEKRDRAAVLMLAVASLLLRGGERVGVLDGGESKPLGHPPAALPKITDRLARGQNDGSLPPLAGLPRHSTVLLFTDGWRPLEEWDKRLSALTAPGVQGHLVQVLDPAEQRLDLTGRVRLEGLEGEGELLLRRAEDLIDAYQERFDAHVRGLQAICRRRGWTYRTHLTDASPLPILLAVHQAISLGRRAAHA
jgi:uncharacterized protein (DUF58 family)